MAEIMLTTLVGFTVGFIFAFLRLPIPAPATFSGVMGIVGLFMGFIVANFLFKQ